MSQPTKNIDDIINEIVQIANDYKEEDIINELHVKTWLEQFEEENRVTILNELAHILKKYYISKERVLSFFEMLLNEKRIFGSGIEENYKNIEFLDIQTKGESQKDLISLLDEKLYDEYNISVTDFCLDSPHTYIYLDDCLFSGNTLINDMKKWINSANNDSSIHFVFFAIHMRNYDYVYNSIKNMIREQNKNIDILFWRIEEIKDRKGSISVLTTNYECLLPPQLEYNEETKNYIEEIKNTRTERQNLYYPILRDSNLPSQETLFSSKENRAIVEKEFLEKGVYIKSLGINKNASIRPLGYDNQKTLGFGSMFISYRNIANNCPLVLWWGDPEGFEPLNKWYPLFPRKVN